MTKVARWPRTRQLILRPRYSVGARIAGPPAAEPNRACRGESAVETRNVTLISYTGADGGSYVGSGLLVDDRTVLTADHVADGTEHRWRAWMVVRRDGCWAERESQGGPGGSGVGRAGEGGGSVGVCADRSGSKWARSECVAVGFPRWKKQEHRRSSQVNGSVPTAEGLTAEADRGLQEGLFTWWATGSRAPRIPAAPTH